MLKKKLSGYIDCDCYLIFGTAAEFKTWVEKRSQREIKIPKSEPFGGNGKCNKPGERFTQYVWVNSNKGQSFPGLIGTLAHEANHYLDRLTDFLCGKDGEEICTELPSRIVQTIVLEGTKMIMKEVRVS